MLTNIIICTCIVVQVFAFGVCGMNIERVDKIKKIYPESDAVKFYQIQANSAWWVGVIFLSITVYLLMKKDF